MEFRPFIDVETLNKDTVEGILIGKCTVFPKYDGSNASIWPEIKDDKTIIIKCGSRKRVLELDKKDNRNFYRYVLDNLNNTLLSFFKEFPDYRLYGEWMIPHTLKTYRDDVWNKFWIFDVYDESQHKFLDYNEYRPFLEKYNLNFIIPYAEILNPTMERLNSILLNNNFGMQENHLGEGIVIKNYSFINRFGRYCYGKIVMNQFKEENMKIFGLKTKKGPKQDEIDFVETYVTIGRIQKVLAKIDDTKKESLIPRLLQTVYYEVINEELYDFTKKKNRIINFSLLKQHCVNKIKELYPTLF